VTLPGSLPILLSESVPRGEVLVMSTDTARDLGLSLTLAFDKADGADWMAWQLRRLPAPPPVSLESFKAFMELAMLPLTAFGDSLTAYARTWNPWLTREAVLDSEWRRGWWRDGQDRGWWET